MSQTTSIEWTERTWNPLRGCSKESTGCENCYAIPIAARFSGDGQAYHGLAKRNPTNWTGQVRFVDEQLDEPLRRRKPTTYFVNSMSDLFHERVPREWIAKIFGIMAYSRRHTFQVLTKRAERMREVVNDLSLSECLNAAGLAPDFLPKWPLPNVWLGVSVENQALADERIPHLLHTPAAVRFLSCEPLLGAVDLSPFLPSSDGFVASEEHGPIHIDDGARTIDWVIVGGESGGGARPCELDWISSIVKLCRVAEVPVFVKQLGSKPYDRYRVRDPFPYRIRDKKGGDPDEWPEDLRVRQYPAGMIQVQKEEVRL